MTHIAVDQSLVSDIVKCPDCHQEMSRKAFPPHLSNYHKISVSQNVEDKVCQAQRPNSTSELVCLEERCGLRFNDLRQWRRHVKAAHYPAKSQPADDPFIRTPSPVSTVPTPPSNQLVLRQNVSSRRVSNVSSEGSFSRFFSPLLGTPQDDISEEQKVDYPCGPALSSDPIENSEALSLSVPDPINEWNRGPTPSAPVPTQVHSSLYLWENMESIGIRLHETHKLVVCIGCGISWLPANVVGHLKKAHNIQVTSSQYASLKEAMEYFEISDSPNMNVPQPGQAPIEGLVIVDNGHCCNACTYCVPLRSSFDKHWSHEHPTTPSPSQGRFHLAPIQTFYNPQPKKYFEVDPSLSLSNAHDPYEVYLRQLANEPPLPIAVPIHDRETPILLQLMQWHTHLASYISEKETCAKLVELVKLPHYTSQAWYSRISIVTNQYIDMVSAMIIDAPLGIRSILKECPRQSQTGPIFYPLTDPETRRSYAVPVTALVQSILRSVDGHVSKYSFPLTPAIISQARTLINIFKSTSEVSIDALHPLLWAAFSPRSQRDTYQKWSDIMERFVAIYSLKPDSTFQSPGPTAALFARLVYWCRVVFFFHGHQHQSEHEYDLALAVEYYCMLNMKPGVLSPYNSIIDNQRAVSALVYSETTAPSTTISPDGTHVSYKGVTIEVERWIVGVHELILDIHQRLLTLSRGQPISINIPKHIPDDMTRTDRGYSWLGNASMLDTPNPLLNILMHDKDLQLCYINSIGALVWNSASARVVLQECSDILSGILVANHVCAGQPSRITELLDSSIRNGNRPRTFFRLHGDLLLVTRRLKTQNITHQESFVCKKVPRGPFGNCPRGLAEINEFYFLVVRPLEEALSRVVWDAQVSSVYNEYMYVRMGSRVNEDQFSSLFRNTMGKFCGVDDVNPRTYRQLIVGIAREYLGSEYDIQEDEDDALAAQTGHGSSTRRLYYANDTVMLPSVSSDALTRFVRMSDAWARLLRLSVDDLPLLPIRIRRRLIQASIEADLSPPGEPVNVQGLVNLVTTTIASSIAQLKVNLEGQIHSAVSSGFAEILSRSSPKRKRGLSDPPPKRLLPLVFPTEELPEDQPDVSVVEAAHRAIRLLYPDSPGATFKSPAQQIMVEMSIANSSSFVAVLPTGGGKSLLYLAPAMVELKGISSVVMIPNKSLLQDSMRKTILHNIPARVWETKNKDEGNARIVFVAMESVGTASFKTWFGSRETKPKRIVIDEAHKVVTEAELRPAFKALSELSRLEVQLVFLTATLPTHAEKAFFKSTGLPHTTTILRASTAVPNLAYHVITVDSQSKPIEQVALDLVTLVGAMPGFGQNSRGIIYCRSRSMVSDLGPHFSNCISHSNLVEHVQKNNQDRWIQGDSQWMVATSGFMHGIDYPHVRVVIFIDEPHSLYNLVQGSGRAGRDGQPCSMYLLRSPSSSIRASKRARLDTVQCLGDMQTWSNNVTACRRLGLASVMDGEQDVSCIQLKDAIKCDICEPDSPTNRLGLAALLPSFTPPTRNPLPNSTSLSPIPTTQGSDAMYDSLFDDTLINDVDLSTISGISLSPVVDGSSRTVISSSTNPSSSAPSPGTGIMLDAALNVEQTRVLHDKVQQMSSLLAHIRGKCVVCWAWKGLHVDKSETHRPFGACGSQGSRFPVAYGWIQFKKRIALTAYRYCFRCGFPQDPFKPDLHPQFNPGDAITCEWDDTVALILWFIKHHPGTWSMAVGHFGSDNIQEGMTVANFTTWVNEDNSGGSFYNGLELVLWFWDYWRKRIMNAS